MTQVKNWNKFQHFKDRRPPWIKLYRDLLDDPDWHEMSGDDAKYLVMIWLIASEDGGILPNIKKLAFRLRLSEQKTKHLLNRLNHWVISDDINMVSDRYQDDAPETETDTETETETEKSLRAVASRRAQKLGEDFERFWKAYPSRKGGNPKHPAKLKFLNACQNGVDPEEIINAAGRFAREMARDRNINTPFVPMAKAWLHQQQFHDYAAVGPPSTIPQEIPQELQDIYRRGWRPGLHLPPELVRFAPDDMLAKHQKESDNVGQEMGRNNSGNQHNGGTGNDKENTKILQFGERSSWKAAPGDCGDDKIASEV